jgi:hypothetical protein
MKNNKSNNTLNAQCLLSNDNSTTNINFFNSAQSQIFYLNIWDLMRALLKKL